MNARYLGTALLAVVLLAGPLTVRGADAPAVDPTSPLGFWKTIDDETGDEKSIVHIFEQDGELFGRIVHLFRKPGEEPDPVCDECKGKNKDKPIKGMVILEGLGQDDDWWTGGTILDPKIGKIYRCKIRIAEEGTLTVRGYIGFSLIGRSQTWHRSEAPAAGE